MFKTLSNERIPVLWNYFGASHGKGEADGAIGRLSMIIDAVVHSGMFEFGNCKELTAYCQQYLKMGDNSRGICCHYHRQYYEVSNIVHVEDTDDIHTIRGTLGFHSVRNTGTPGVIEVHASSCFCEPCFLDTPGECRNKRLVKKFLWASLYKVNSTKATKAVTIFENTLWNSTSDKYVPMTHPVAKHRTVMLNAPSKYPNSTTREITVYDDESDCDNLNSCDSDYEENIPLCYLLHDEAKTPISSHTCTHLNRKPWICSTLEPLKLDLNDYKGPII